MQSELVQEIQGQTDAERAGCQTKFLGRRKKETLKFRCVNLYLPCVMKDSHATMRRVCY